MTASRHPFVLPLARPLTTASGRIEERRGWVVRYERDGTVGLGEATPLPGFTESRDRTDAALDAAIEALAADGWPAALAAVGDAPAARTAVTTARLDWRARRNDQPLYRDLSAGEGDPTVPVNATVGDGSVEATVEAATDAVDAGFETIKVKVGARGLDADVERVRAVREAVGPDVALRIDANGSWDRETAERAIGEFESLAIDHLEQPLAPDDRSGHRSLRGRIPIAVDESLAVLGWRPVLESEAADVLVLKPMALGGPDVTRAVAVHAADRGVRSVVSNTIDGAVARTAAAHVAASLPAVEPAGLATATLLERDLAPDPVPVRDGAVSVADAPGLGIDEVTVDA
ncbi:MAG: mandelate racemase/muconate lactonizing enzyme family protein [Halanaeroarchaeum sp.]